MPSCASGVARRWAMRWAVSLTRLSLDQLIVDGADQALRGRLRQRTALQQRGGNLVDLASS